MITLTAEQQKALMRHPRRVAAQKKLDAVVKRVRTDIAKDGDALYYLTVLPHYVKQLQAAYDRLCKTDNELKKQIVCGGVKNAENKI